MHGGDIMSMINAFWPFVLMAGIFYFMLWRPQKKEQQKRQSMLESLKKGDKIVTIGGVCGTITNISERKVTVEVAENVEMNFLRTAISGFQDPSRNNGNK